MDTEKKDIKKSSSVFSKFPLNLLKYFARGIYAVILFILKLIKYFFFGFSLPILIINLIRRKIDRRIANSGYTKEQKKLLREEKNFQKQLLEQKKFKEDSINSNVRQDTAISGINDNNNLKSSIGNADIKEALLLDLNKLNEEKSSVKLMYQYIAKAPDGKNVKGYFEAYSKVEVLSYLISEGYEVYSVKTNKYIRFLHSSATYSNTKMATKDLIFFLTQLSTYIKSGIPLVDSLKILVKQYKQVRYQQLLKALIYNLSTGDSFSEALNKQGNAFPKILVNMVKAAEMTGELPETLDDMSDYFTQIEKTRKQMITALMYPTIILVVAVAVVIFIMLWIIPQFEKIYISMGADVPSFTRLILNLSAFLQDNIIKLLLGFIVLLIIFIYLYKNVKLVRYCYQWVTMHIPVIKNVIIYNEVTTFTKTFSSLLSHNVFITDSMEILSKLTNNEIYKGIILDTIVNLAKGEKISKSFQNHWAFPLPAYEMLVTGEKTGQLPEMMKKVSDYYQELHANSVSRIKTFMEPILIVFLTVVVGGIVLAIVIPMFGMYEAVQQLG